MKIMDDGEQTIPCAESKCSIIVDDEIVKSFVVDTDVLSKYKRLICNSFVKVKSNSRTSINDFISMFFFIFSVEKEFALV